MSDYINDIPALIVQYLNETISETDKVILNQWICHSTANRVFFEQYTNEEYVAGELNKIYAYDTGAAWKRFQRRVYPKAYRIQVWRRYVAAAVLIATVSGAAYWWVHRTTEFSSQDMAARYKNDVPAGGEKATLTLANGQVIVLDSAQNGVLQQQANVTISKKQGGELVYNATGSSDNTKLTSITYNTLATPIGGQYRLILPDGSKVWLNAASSIHYPAVFAANKREVDITGEAYFEVAHIASKRTATANGRVPFVVHANGIAINVLGTKFNVNVYSDEPVITTSLLEGSVRLQNNEAEALLQPGQQAKVATTDAKAIQVNDQEDIEDNIAWVNNYFQFTNANIEQVMRQISRWYDISVQYKGTVGKRFTGSIPKNISAVSLFKILEATGGVTFAIDGKQVTVMP